MNPAYHRLQAQAGIPLPYPMQKEFHLFVKDYFEALRSNWLHVLTCEGKAMAVVIPVCFGLDT